MNESEKQFSFTCATPSTSGRAKNQIPISFICVFLASVLLLITGCAQAPSEEDIEAAVKQRIGIGKDPYARFISLQIVEKGKYNKEQKYWPYRATLKFQRSYDEGRTWKDFNVTDTMYLRLQKDDFGKQWWTMSGIYW